MNTILVRFFFVAVLSQHCQAILQVDSPDGKWSIQTKTGDTKPAVAIFDSGRHPTIVIDPDTTGSKRLCATWSSDSKRAVLVDQSPLGSGVTVAWFDGAKWHASVESDGDLEQAQALAKSQGINGQVKAEEREPGNWLSEDTIEVHGLLRYLSGRSFFTSIPCRLSLALTRRIGAASKRAA